MKAFPFPEIRERRITLTLDGDGVGYRAPQGTMTAAILEAIKQHKAGLMDLLSVPGVSDCLGCPASAWWTSANGEEGLCCFSYAYFSPVKGNKPALCRDQVAGCKHRQNN